MFKSGSNGNGKFSAGIVAGAGLLLSALFAAGAAAQEGRQLESIDVQSLPGQVIEFRLQLNQAAPDPVSFTIGDPARIAVDLAGTALALEERQQNVNIGAVATVQAAEGNGRTRVIFNLNSMVPYTTRVEGNTVVVEVGGSADRQPAVAAAGGCPRAPEPGRRSADAHAPTAATYVR